MAWGASEKPINCSERLYMLASRISLLSSSLLAVTLVACGPSIPPPVPDARELVRFPVAERADRILALGFEKQLDLLDWTSRTVHGETDAELREILVRQGPAIMPAVRARFEREKRPMTRWQLLL